MRSGDTATARELAAYAAELGRRFGVADLEMLGLALEGAALVACAQVPDGMRYLDEATAIALEGEAEIPISSAWTCCFLVSACTAVLDYERAFEWCDRISEFAERYGSRYMLAFCRAEYGAVHLWRGRWKDAETMLEASIDDFSRSRPAWVAAPLVGLAELRRRQGRSAEAMRLLDEAGAGPRAQLCRARLALERGETLRAAELIERLLRQLPETARWNEFRRSSCSSMPGWRAASSTRPRRHSRRCATSKAWSVLRRCVPAPTGPRACSRLPEATTTAPDAARGCAGRVRTERCPLRGR